MGKFQPFPNPKTELQVGCEYKNLSHEAPATPARDDIFMALQEDPEGFRRGISSSLLAAELQSAVPNCTLQGSPTLQFHVRNCHPCSGNTTKPRCFIPLTEQKELLVPKKMMDMEWFGPVRRLMGLGNAGWVFFPLYTQVLFKILPFGTS